MQLTHLGGPTVLVELAGWRILTDPTFDPPGRRYSFGWGTTSRKTAGPALREEQVGPVDVVLLSHDHHADNLDERGRALLPKIGTVITTRPGARRLGATNVRGLAPGEVTTLHAPGKVTLTVRATPCRHGPPLSRPIAGAVVGFAIFLEDSPRAALWMTGDTVLHSALRRAAADLDVMVALLHLGSVQFPITGPLRYSMSGADALELIDVLGPEAAIPVHYEGWSHFRQDPASLRQVLDAAPSRIRDVVSWLEPGEPLRFTP